MDARARQFALWAIPLLLIFFAIYPYLLPGYCSAVRRVSATLLGLFHPPIGLDVQIDGTWLVSMPVSKGRLTFVMNHQKFTHEVVFLGLAVLPALVLATPVRIVTRVRLVLVALALLFFVHALSLTIVMAALAKYCHGKADGRTCEVIAMSLIPWGQITIFGLWGLVTWRYWFSSSRRSADRGSAPLRTR